MKRASFLRNGFTLIELLTVMAIIVVLAALVIAGARIASVQAAQKRAEAEIQALSAACESYKIDNGDYPRDANTDALDPKVDTSHPVAPSGTVAKYQSASLALYKALSGDNDLDGSGGDMDTGTNQKYKVYYEFKPSNYLKTGTVQCLTDPFHKPYGYSTKYSADQLATPTATPGGYNPTFDLWSTGDPSVSDTGTVDHIQAKWIKNW